MYKICGRRAAKLLMCQISCLGLFAISVLCMPMTEPSVIRNGNDGIVYILAALFWVSLMALIVTTVLLSLVCKNGAKECNFANHKGIGLIRFFRNKYAMVADIVMLISFVAFAAVVIWAEHLLVVSFVVLAILIFSFGMHCILNGANYKFVMETRRRKKHE